MAPENNCDTCKNERHATSAETASSFPPTNEIEQRLRDIADNLPDGMIYQIISDRGGSRRFTFLSGAVQHLHGCTAEEGMADPNRIYNTVIEEDLRRVIAEEETALANLSVFRTEVRIRTPSGKIRWSYFASKPRVLPDGMVCWDGLELDITERKNIEEALWRSHTLLENGVRERTHDLAARNEQLEREILNRRKAETALRALMDAIPESAFLMYPNGKVIQANEHTARRLGVSLERLLDGNIFELLEPEVAANRRQKIAELMATMKPVSFVDQRAGRDIENHMYPVYDPDGIVRSLAILGLDITEKIEAENRLREKTTELENYFTAALDLFSIASLDGCFRRLNKQWERTLGLSLEEMEGRNILDFVHPDDVEKTKEALSLLSAHLQVVNFINRFRCKDGSYRALEWRCLPSDNSIFAAARDVTEHIQTMNALNDSQRRLADIIDFLPDATLVINTAGKVVAWNRAIEALTGIPATDMLGKGNYEYSLPFYGERRPILADLVLTPQTEVEKKYAELERSGDYLFGESYTPQLPNGPAYLSATAAVLRDSRGVVTGAIECIRDNTARKMADERAKAADQAKKMFLANMSHELRTPLNSILGFAQLLNREIGIASNEQLREYTGDILAAGTHLLQLVSDLLDVSKIEAGKTVMECSWLDLDELLTNALTTVAERAKTNGVRLSQKHQPTLDGRKIYADGRMIRQVLYNLLDNAIKFTASGGEIELIVNENESDFEFVVSDTGIGVKQRDQRRIFEVFEQADTGYGRSFQGSGLGLALSKRLIELHGGRIWVESKGDASGSRFCFLIPKPRHG